jgi:hypothetical protein
MAALGPYSRNASAAALGSDIAKNRLRSSTIAFIWNFTLREIQKISHHRKKGKV